MTPKLETDLLAELVEAKRETLRQLRDLGLQQQAAVQSGDTELLFRVLAAKQKMLAGLQQVEQRLAPFRQQDPDQRAWRSSHHRQQCADKAAECSQLLAEVIQQERESEQALTHRRDDAAARLQAVHSAIQLQQCYGAPGPSSSAGLDLTCGD